MVDRDVGHHLSRNVIHTDDDLHAVVAVAGRGPVAAEAFVRIEAGKIGRGQSVHHTPRVMAGHRSHRRYAAVPIVGPSRKAQSVVRQDPDADEFCFRAPGLYLLRVHVRSVREV